MILFTITNTNINTNHQLPLPLLVPIIRDIPLRVEYRFRINAIRPLIETKKEFKDSKVILSTGVEKIDISLDELNFCLEWDEKSPLWVSYIR